MLEGFRSLNFSISHVSKYQLLSFNSLPVDSFLCNNFCLCCQHHTISTYIYELTPLSNYLKYII
jgi:hypothetical protein